MLVSVLLVSDVCFTTMTLNGFEVMAVTVSPVHSSVKTQKDRMTAEWLYISFC